MQKEIIIFYSWQSDLPSNNNRNLIQSSIEKAVKSLNKKAIAISADRDTAGKLGTPDIVETIFNKIDEADVFIADVSIINNDSSTKKTPNPNVLLELGYAAKAIGWDRIICIINSDYGVHEELPFDLRTRRIYSYSPSNSDKSEIKSEISRIIEKTVEDLISNEMLPRQNLEVQENKELLSNILKEGINRAWISYYKRKMDIYDGPLENDFVVVTDAHFIMIEKIRNFIKQDQYFLLHDMLDLLQKMRKGSDDAYGWEYAQIFVEKYLEPIYLEYFTLMNKVELMNTLKEEVLDAYNSLLTKNNKAEYRSSRYSDNGELIFLTEKYHQEAYDNKNNLLCKVDLDDKGRISGWKRTDDYVGEYQHGKRSGNGIEYSKDYHYNIYKKREGTWKDDIFIHGVVYDVILSYEEGDYTYVSDKGELPLSKDDEYIREMFRNEGPNYCRNYYFGDMTLIEGKYEIVEGTVKPICSELGGSLECHCYECELL